MRRASLRAGPRGARNHQQPGRFRAGRATLPGLPSIRRPALRALLSRERPVGARGYTVDFGRDLVPRGSLDARAGDCRLFLRVVEPRQVAWRGRATVHRPALGHPWLQRNRQDVAGYWIPRSEVDRLSQPQGPRFVAFSRAREQCFPFACVVNSLGIRAESTARRLLNHIQWWMSGETIHEKQSEFRAEGTSCPALSQHAGSGDLSGALPAHAREVAPDWTMTVLHQERSPMPVSPGGPRCLGGSRNARVHIAESGGKCLSTLPAESRASGL